MRDGFRWIVFALVIAAAAWLRLAHLGSEGMWVDEAYTALLTRGSYGQILTSLDRDDAPPLFYYLEKAWTDASGWSETATRALPVAAGVAVVAVAFFLARRHLPQAAWLVAVFFAFSSMAAFYSRQARSYSIMHLFSLLLLGAALALRERPTAKRAGLFVLWSLAVLYTHNLGVLLVVPALAIAAIGLVKPGRPQEIGLEMLLILAIGASPWTLRLMGQLGVHAELNQWMGEWWKHRPLAAAPLYSLAAFTNSAGPALHPPVSLPGPPPGFGWLRWILWGVAAAGIVLSVRALARDPAEEPGPNRSAWRGTERATYGAFLLFALVPLAGLVGISLTIGPAYVLGRTDTLALPGFLLAVAAGLARIRPRAVPAVAAALWIGSGVLSLVPLWNGAPGIAKKSDRALASNMAGVVTGGDAIVLGPLSRPTLEYYARREGWWGRPSWVGSFPASLDKNPAGVVPTPLDSASAYLDQALKLRHKWEESGIRSVWLLAAADRLPPARGAPPEPFPWAIRPAPPPAIRKSTEANSISYPMNLLVAALVGLHPVEVVWEYHQDWVGADRYVLRIDRARWVSADSLPRLEVRR